MLLWSNPGYIVKFFKKSTFKERDNKRHKGYMYIQTYIYIHIYNLEKLCRYKLLKIVVVINGGV